MHLVNGQALRKGHLGEEIGARDSRKEPLRQSHMKKRMRPQGQQVQRPWGNKNWSVWGTGGKLLIVTGGAQGRVRDNQRPSKGLGWRVQLGQKSNKMWHWKGHSDCFIENKPWEGKVKVGETSTSVQAREERHPYRARSACLWGGFCDSLCWDGLMQPLFWTTLVSGSAPPRPQQLPQSQGRKQHFLEAKQVTAVIWHRGGLRT